MRTPTSAAISSSDTASTPRVPNRSSAASTTRMRVFPVTLISGVMVRAGDLLRRGAVPHTGRVTASSTTTAPSTLTFPVGFSWGTATASFQIEGATQVDGRTDSIWDTFCRVPGAIAGGDTGEPACDHYRRMPEDVALMADLGLDTYRFSVAWPRVRPTVRRGQPGRLDFYSRLVDELLAHDIRPWVTLYHWDLPQTLEDAGGWTNRDTAVSLRGVHRRSMRPSATGSDVDDAERAVVLGLSRLRGGVHAPGRTEPEAAVAAVHHLLLAHGSASRSLRAGGAEQVGITLNFNPVTAAHPTTRRTPIPSAASTGCTTGSFSTRSCAVRTRPTSLDDLAPFGLGDHIRDGDLELIAAPIDVLGVNYYSTAHVEAQPPRPARRRSRRCRGRWASTPPATCRGVCRARRWMGVEADGLRRLLVRIHTEYPATPLVITENGSAWDDTVGPDGEVDDPERVEYLRDHLAAAHRRSKKASTCAATSRGRCSTTSNGPFGYGKRFGIVHVDYATQLRTPEVERQVLRRHRPSQRPLTSFSGFVSPNAVILAGIGDTNGNGRRRNRALYQMVDSCGRHHLRDRRVAHGETNRHHRRHRVRRHRPRRASDPRRARLRAGAGDPSRPAHRPRPSGPRKRSSTTTRSTTSAPSSATGSTTRSRAASPPSPVT